VAQVVATLRIGKRGALRWFGVVRVPGRFAIRRKRWQSPERTLWRRSGDAGNRLGAGL